MDVKSLYGDVKKENLCEMAKWEQYDKAKPKVLFVLKEPSRRRDSSNYNFKKDLGELEEEGLKRMWKLLGKCSEGLQEIGKGSKDVKFDSCKTSLKSSSYMNLKRFGEGRSSDMSLVGLHTGLFWALMMGEIKELKPDIIVFCKTFDFFKELIKCLNKLPNYTKEFGYSSLGKISEPYKEVEIKMKGKNKKTCYWTHWKCDNISQKPIGVIQMSHPDRKNHKQYFNDLMELGSNIVKERHKIRSGNE